MDPKIFGVKLKQLYPNRLAKDGRTYAQHSDEELGQKYITKYGGQVEAMQSGQYPGVVPEEERLGVGIGLDALKESGERVKGTESAEEQKKTQEKSDADRILSGLEDLYFNANNGEGLHYGRLRGILELGSAMAGENADLNTYMKQLQSDRPTFTKAAGDTGNFSKSEQEAAIKQFPTNFSTKEEAVKYFAATRRKFGLKPSLRSYE